MFTLKKCILLHLLVTSQFKASARACFSYYTFYFSLCKVITCKRVTSQQNTSHCSLGEHMWFFSKNEICKQMGIKLPANFKFRRHCLCGGVIDDHVCTSNLGTVGPSWSETSTKLHCNLLLWFPLYFINIKSSGAELYLLACYFIIWICLRKDTFGWVDPLNIFLDEGEKPDPPGIRGLSISRTTLSPLRSLCTVTWEAWSGAQGTELWGQLHKVSPQAPSPGGWNSLLQLGWPFYSECFIAWLKMFSCLQADCRWGLE